MGARELSARELMSAPHAVRIPAVEPNGLDVVETQEGIVWLRLVSDGQVMGMNPVQPDDLTRIGRDLIEAAEVARQHAFKRKLGLN